MKNDTYTLELTREEIKTIKFALLLNYDWLIGNRVKSEGWQDKQVVFGRLIESLDILLGERLGDKLQAEAYAQMEHERHSAAIKRGLAAKKASQKVKSGV